MTAAFVAEEVSPFFSSPDLFEQVDQLERRRIMLGADLLRRLAAHLLDDRAAHRPRAHHPFRRACRLCLVAKA